LFFRHFNSNGRSRDRRAPPIVLGLLLVLVLVLDLACFQFAILRFTGPLGNRRNVETFVNQCAFFGPKRSAAMKIAGMFATPVAETTHITLAGGLAGGCATDSPAGFSFRAQDGRVDQVMFEP